MSDLLTKYDTESEVFTFDFTNKTAVASGDLLASIVSVTSLAGLTIGTPAIDGTSKKVNVKISGGVAGTEYHVFCRCLTVSGQEVDGCGRLYVKSC